MRMSWSPDLGDNDRDYIEFVYVLSREDFASMLPEGVSDAKIDEGLRAVEERWENWLNDQAAEIVEDVASEIEEEM